MGRARRGVRRQRTAPSGGRPRRTASPWCAGTGGSVSCGRDHRPRCGGAEHVRVLVWQWGRRGAGPRIAAQLAAAFNELADTEGLLSLSNSAEILHGAEAPPCDLPIQTYATVAGLARRFAASPGHIARLSGAVRSLRPDLAVCAMPGPMDWIFALALRRTRVPFAVIVHDAIAHPGDGYPLQMLLQRRFLRAADAVIALSAHVAEQVRKARMGGKVIRGFLPPLVFGPPAARIFAHGGPPRLLHFGRLLPYKGLDLLAAAIEYLAPAHDFALRVVGSGPESDDLNRLRSLACVTVENRWVPEAEVASLLDWADALVLPYREASQSGVAAAAVAAGRFVIATRVGGLKEQLASQPLGILCEPNSQSLAEAIRTFLVSPPAPRPITDPAEQWRQLAAVIARSVATKQSRPEGRTA
ncbi:MAG: glycosyltransferase [Acetobacteraceae bacterium]|nr:glycosyltransferase [Acetobacteraceae bacterium]